MIGDPSRAAMLWTLMGGESRPASELALLANVSPQTASNHLRLLRDAGFLNVSVVGRNKFYSLGGPHVAAALEALAAAIQGLPSSGGAAHEQTPELVFARTCYDHLAGEGRGNDESAAKQRVSERTGRGLSADEGRGSFFAWSGNRH
jgi:DNA-binding transcriptional ArsR family regulator